MYSHLEKVSALRIAGIGSVLGLDIYRNRVRVIELKSRGGIFNKFRTTYIPGHHFTLDFRENSSASDRGKQLAEELKKRGMKTRFCVSTVRSSNSRLITVDIPTESAERDSEGEIETWIGENYEKLIRVPIPLKELAFDYEIISGTIESICCEVAFVRTSERDHLIELTKAAGLHLLLLGMGARAAEVGFLAIGTSLAGESRGLIVADDDEFACSVFRGGDAGGEQERVQRKTFRAAGLDDAIASLRKEFGGIDALVISGPGAPKGDPPQGEVWSPLGLSPEYALAVGLAVEGFIFASSIGQPTHAIDLRPEGVRITSLEERDKSLFRIATLSMGLILIVLLAIQFGIQSYLQGASARLDDKLERIGPVFSQVRMLKRQVDELNLQLSGRDALRQSSTVAKTLHEIAASTPKDVWLYKLVYSRQDSTSQSVKVWGYSRTNGDAANYLAGLQTNPSFTDVQVVRIGAPTQLELASFINNNLKSFVTFQVKLIIAR